MNNNIIHLDLFSGIGGFALAADWVWKNVTHIFCEIEPYPQKVLHKHWPDAKIYNDIKDLSGHEIKKEFNTIDILTGGFPCQPFSCAGKRGGKNDDRYLWPEMFRVVKEARPRWIVAENVPGIVNMELDQVFTDLESAGYETGTVIVPACACDAPHIRQRVWILANAVKSDCGQRDGKITTERYPDSAGKKPGPTILDYAQDRENRLGECGKVVKKERGKKSTNVAVGFSGAAFSNAYQPGLSESTRAIFSGVYEQAEKSTGCEPGRIATKAGNYWSVEPGVGRVANGIPHRVDRLKGLGNAIVPQVAATLMCFIKEIDKQDVSLC